MNFWERTWQEREDVLKLAFGETDPPGWVESFSWNDRILPGACSLAFPPIESSSIPPRQQRKDWLYLTMGLSQPLDKDQVEAERKAEKSYSSYGYELGFLVAEQCGWPPDALYYFVTHILDGREIRWGDRFPFGFGQRDVGADLFPYVGRLDGLDLVGNIRAVLFWPYLLPETNFLTSTGKFFPMIAMGITQDEWALAKQTTTVHLLLLLCRAGVGQCTYPERKSVLEYPRWSMEWDAIARLSPEHCDQELNAGIGRWHLAEWVTQ